MTVYLTGSEGFIGKNISKRVFAEKKFDLINGNKDDIFDCDICARDLIIHNGAISSTRASDISEIFDLNIKYTQRLMDKCYQSGARLIYASSASVYGNGEFGFSEKSNMSPKNLYAKSKKISDILAEEYIGKGASIVGLRYFNVYGPEDQNKGDMSSVIAKFYSQSKKDGIIRLFDGSENIYRDFIYIDDVIGIIEFFSNNNITGIYNCGTGTERSFMDIAKIISERFSSKIEQFPMPEHLKAGYQFFTKSDNLNIEKHIKYGYTSVEDGVNMYIDYLEGIDEIPNYNN